MTDYQIFGWRVQSAIPLPDLLPCCDDAGAPDVTITLGPVPPLDSPVRQFSPAVQIGDGVVRIAIPTVAAYRVEAGRRIIIETALPLTAPDIRVFLQSTVLAVLCFQRQFLPLHASVVEVDGRALVLSGDSGSGKSTLAASLVQRGFRLLSDDLCLLDTDGLSAPQIQPAFPQLRLWRQAADHLGMPTTGLAQSRPGIEKHHHKVTETYFCNQSLPPALVVNMRFVEYPHPLTLTQLGQGVAMGQYNLIHRWRLGLALGRQPLFFTALASLVRHCPVFNLVRARNFDTLDVTVDHLLALIRGEPINEART